MVASYMGAWIEIFLLTNPSSLAQVASYMGAWIEISSSCISSMSSIMSHPIWVRGLKSVWIVMNCFSNKSHPIWVRGLKYVAIYQ